MTRNHLTTFSEEDINSTRPEMKVGLLATVTPEGLPHVTMLSTVMACGPAQVCFGQFTEGMSKKHILQNPKTGFLMMSLDRNLWRGKATYTHSARNGREYDYYNNVPMFRYNAYFGVHTVYYLDLVEQTGKTSLPMNRIILAALQTMLARMLGGKHGRRSPHDPRNGGLLRVQGRSDPAHQTDGPRLRGEQGAVQRCLPGARPHWSARAGHGPEFALNLVFLQILRLVQLQKQIGGAANHVAARRPAEKARAGAAKLDRVLACTHVPAVERIVEYAQQAMPADQRLRAERRRRGRILVRDAPARDVGD